MIIVNCNFYIASSKSLSITCCVALFSVLIVGGLLTAQKAILILAGKGM